MNGTKDLIFLESVGYQTEDEANLRIREFWFRFVGNAVACKIDGDWFIVSPRKI